MTTRDRLPPLRRILPAVLAVSLMAGTASAQDADAAAEAKRKAEIRRLEGLLAKVEEAIETLRPLARPSFESRIYDVRSILSRPEDRRAPSLSVPRSSAGMRTGAGAKAGKGMVLSFGDDGSDDWSGGLDPDSLIERLMTQTGALDRGDGVGYSVISGVLFVRETAAMHARIAKVLEGLRADARRTVRVEVSVFELSDAESTALDRDSRDRKGVISAERFAKLESTVDAGQATLERRSLLSAYTGCRVFLHRGHERSIIAGYQVSSGGTGLVTATVAIPEMRVLRTGHAMDLRVDLGPGEGEERQVSLELRSMVSIFKGRSIAKTTFGPIDIPQLGVETVVSSARLGFGEALVVSERRSKPGKRVVTLVRPLAAGD